MCEKIRCSWAGDLPIYVEYHDQEWGRPVHEDNKLFEMLILEGMQAGLSWITVLKKRKAFREAFDCFDPVKVSLYDEEKIQELQEQKKHLVSQVLDGTESRGSLTLAEIREILGISEAST